MARYLSASLEGTGGQIKESSEDFLVEEIPLYLPCGEGEHLYVEVEKTGLTTFDLIQKVAGALKIRSRDIGYAGLKDARATTRQRLSLQRVTPAQVESLQLPGIRVLSCAWHRNKLRLGHLAGNRFTIRIRAVKPGALEKAEDILHVLKTVGVPNRFGQQRYGVLGNSHLIGRALLRQDYELAGRLIIGDPQSITQERWREAAERFERGDLDGTLAALPARFRDERNLVAALGKGHPAREAVFTMPRNRLRLYLSAYQSSLFDRLVDMRLDTLDTLWAGDYACKHENGACFIVEDPAKEQPRADSLEISPSAPLYGYKVSLARGQAGILEEGLLAKEKLSLQDFRLSEGLGMEGERRPLRVPLGEYRVDMEGQDLRLSFSLPRGSYATSVLAEVMKSEEDPSATTPARPTAY
ncbi:tRNA pseudouridine(13) synthase TruD [Desulfuromonas sp. KJ2020]|uniref:tRNA pseudouridine(13) synthase TruD n=1 Tax=Desulfuromonas sp. KJ2020 TaxID=2919173 RepID=UPI0020A81F4F|nr:tRNA pseudouridine(13) synthase TruD [Desulfuromonas sp. KJ2020]MCP3176783.1 tRNA pseudouridine(13) synthase TruD [Desulfuromonas sp. KJ2020]